MCDLFDEIYFAGVMEEDSPAEVAPPPTTETDRATPRHTHRSGEPRLMAMPAADRLALGGCVIAADRVFEHGYVTIEGNRIAEVGATPPSDAMVHETNGVILPGLIDLHGHPEYNVFAAWEPPRLFENRSQWRAHKYYEEVVKKPWRALTKTKAEDGQSQQSLIKDLTRYSEIRALVGGATAIQGSSGNGCGSDESLVRNVDRWIFDQHRARSILDPLNPRGEDDVKSVDKMIADAKKGDIDAIYMHVAEGVDAKSRDEFRKLAERGLLLKQSVFIHGTALEASDFKDMKDAGAKLVWSPQSNLRLYGRTTNVLAAVDLGIPVGLGADWVPSGSMSLLGELKVARRMILAQGFTGPEEELAKWLVEAVTSTAADIAGLSQHIGRLEAGKAADVLVLERRRENPWLNVLDADPTWVELVMIDGDLTYGRADWMTALADPADMEPIEASLAWGKQMLLDASYSVRLSKTPPPKLSEIRTRLMERYARIGPIFA